MSSVPVYLRSLLAVLLLVFLIISAPPGLVALFSLFRELSTAITTGAPHYGEALFFLLAAGHVGCLAASMSACFRLLNAPGNHWSLKGPMLLLATSMVWLVLLLLIPLSAYLETAGWQTSGVAVASLLLHAVGAASAHLMASACCLLGAQQAAMNNMNTKLAENDSALATRNQVLQDEIFVREEAERAFRKSYQRYRTLVQTAGSPIIAIDAAFRIQEWNTAAEQLFGFTREQVMGAQYIERCVPRAFQKQTQWKIRQVLETGVKVEHMENEMLGGDGAVKVIYWSISCVSGEPDNSVIIVGQDITSIRETQDKLHYLAHYDALTGAANRRLFEDRCTQAIRQMQRTSGSLCLLALDIDHFKQINDTLGHDVGDRLLQTIFTRMQENLRQEDTVARLGGDEFAILLTNVRSRKGCERVARTLLEAITHPISLPGREIVVTTSIGMTIAPDDGNTYQALLKNADMALYQSKESGRNTISFFNEHMQQRLMTRLTMEQSLREAVAEKRFELLYQPQFELNTFELIGVESLLRWRTPDGTLATPDMFLEAAEGSGLLQQMSEWILRHSVAAMLELEAATGRRKTLSVNLSSRQFLAPELPEQIATVIKQTGVDPSSIYLEINEQSLVNYAERSEKQLQRLRQLGICIALDSFGSGLTSFSVLHRWPIDAIKIDRKLLDGVPEDVNQSALLETLCAVSRQMDKIVMIEGIETEAQLIFLRRLGIHNAQGHLFAEPLAMETLLHKLRTTSWLHPERFARQIGLPLDN